MAHLSCMKHGRRVVYRPLINIVRHRNGDGSLCTSSSFKIKDLIFAREVLIGMTQIPLDPGEKILKEVFTEGASK